MRIVAAFLAVAALTAGLLWRREASRSAESQAETERLRASAKELKAKLDKAVSEAAARLETEEAGTEPTPAPAVTEKTVIRDDTATRNELVKLLDEKQAALAESRKSIDEVTARLREAEAKIATLAAAQERFAAVERDLKDQVETANRVSAALDAEVKGRSDRMVRIDSTNRELQKKLDDSGKKVERMAKASSEIEDLARRREVYLNNVLRRYREVTDQYRTLAVRMNSPRETAFSSAGTDLSRIQNAIMLAEEDLRQLQTLNAQAARLHKDIAAAARN